MTTSAKDYFREGNLAEAIQATIAEVKSNPTDSGLRFHLAQYLILAGDLDRADLHFDMATDQDPTWGPAASMLRQLLRGEKAREEFFLQGRAPELVTDPSEFISLALKASIAVREERWDEARELLEQAEEKRVKPKGRIDGQSFDDFRDMDDLLSGVLEIVTTNGKYFWIPMEQIEELKFEKPEKLKDIIWRRTEISVADGGPQGVVFVPMTYWAKSGTVEDGARLSRMTDWVGEENGVVRGVGHRCFLVGERAEPLSSVTEVLFDRETG